MSPGFWPSTVRYNCVIPEEQLDAGGDGIQLRARTCHENATVQLLPIRSDRPVRLEELAGIGRGASSYKSWQLTGLQLQQNYVQLATHPYYAFGEPRLYTIEVFVQSPWQDTRLCQIDVAIFMRDADEEPEWLVAKLADQSRPDLYRVAMPPGVTAVWVIPLACSPMAAATVEVRKKLGILPLCSASSLQRHFPTLQIRARG